LNHQTDRDEVQSEHQATTELRAARGAQLRDQDEESGAPTFPTPDPEVVAKPQRRRFTAAEKRRILEEADSCEHGELGALLRREGIHYSTLRKWRDARDKAAYEALENKKPGPTATEPHPAEVRVAELERENQRLREELTKAKVIIDVQKKVSELLGLSPQDESSETS